MRRCRTCGRERPASDYASGYARRCMECVAQVTAASVCGVCGVQVALSVKGEPRKVCARDECRSEVRRRGQQAALSALLTRQLPPTKVCPWCGVDKPRTTEHFGSRGSFTLAGRARLDHVCKPCRTAYARDRYRSVPHVREQALARSAERRVKTMQRVESDPVFAAQWRQQRLQWEAERRARVRARRLAGAPEHSDDVSGSASVSALPVYAAIYEHVAAHGVTVGAFCEQAGIGERALSRWNADGRGHVVLVDRALLALDALWWEVFDPERFPGLYTPLRWIDVVDEASEAFADERLLAVA